MSTTSRSPRKRPTTRSSSGLTRRSFVGGLGAGFLTGIGTLLPVRSPATARRDGTVPGPRHDSGAFPGSGPVAAPSQRTGAITEPSALVLGTAQDAGVPQVNCFTGVCRAVRRGDRPAPRVASLGLVDPADGRRFLIDATPDFVAQVGDLLGVALEGAPPLPEDGVVPLHERLHGVLLTHGHMGHYTGLVHCGREAAAARDLPVYCNPEMAALLRGNEPWKYLVDNRHIRLFELTVGTPVRLSASLEILPLDVVHRAELAGMTGYLVRGPRRSLLYVPDADTWDGWPIDFERWLGRADVALLDGSFWSGAELGHRPQAEVPHPPVSATLERLDALDDPPETWFIHLNHTNPLWTPGSEERRAVGAAGAGIATTGQRIAL